MLCSLAACASKRPELVDPEIVERDGIVYLAGSTEPLTADIVVFFEDGQLENQLTVIDGKPEGLGRKWHENGQLAREANFFNGKVEGLSRYWYKNGQLENEINYVNGEREGLSRSWYEN